MPAGQEPRANGMGKSIKSPGIKIIQIGLHKEWGKRSAIHWDFTICWAMSGNGAGTGLGIIQEITRKIGAGLKVVPVGFFAAAVGARLPGAARRLFAATATRPLTMSSSVFVLPGQARLLRNLHGAWSEEIFSNFSLRLVRVTR